MKEYTSCTWLQPLLNCSDRAKVVERTLQELKPHDDKFTAIACTGYSSSLISSIIANEMNKDLIVVRKESDSRHSGHLVEGPKSAKYIFIDDMISTGQTWLRVKDTVSERLKGVMIGIYLYYDFNYRPPILNLENFYERSGVEILNLKDSKLL